ncbi:hypothetical protein Tco_0088334 [Tanacetum coccineum]
MEECYQLLTDKIDLVNLEGHWVVPDVSKPLPLGGLQGQVTIQHHFFFNKDLEYLKSGDKERRNALSISKLKVVHYLDFGLEELWKEFYITRHNASSDRCAVKSHMRILSVTSLKTYERYSYTYLRDIILCRANYKEYKIFEADFKNLHPSDFEDLYLIHLQGKLNYLPGSDYNNHDLSRQEVWNDCKSYKVRVGSMGNLLWEAFVLLGRKVHEDDVAKTVFRMRNGHVEVYGYAFWVNQCTSSFHGVNEPGADNFVVYYDAQSKDLEACLEKGEGDFLYVATTKGGDYHLGMRCASLGAFCGKECRLPFHGQKLETARLDEPNLVQGLC